jgi:hypothetical protein
MNKLINNIGKFYIDERYLLDYDRSVFDAIFSTVEIVHVEFIDHKNCWLYVACSEYFDEIDFMDDGEKIPCYVAEIISDGEKHKINWIRDI